VAFSVGTSRTRRGACPLRAPSRRADRLSGVRMGSTPGSTRALDSLDDQVSAARTPPANTPGATIHNSPLCQFIATANNSSAESPRPRHAAPRQAVSAVLRPLADSQRSRAASQLTTQQPQTHHPHRIIIILSQQCHVLGNVHQRDAPRHLAASPVLWGGGVLDRGASCMAMGQRWGRAMERGYCPGCLVLL